VDGARELNMGYLHWLAPQQGMKDRIDRTDQRWSKRHPCAENISGEQDRNARRISTGIKQLSTAINAPVAMANQHD
jgi:hypothetical protein